jgi:hypothetical protein
MSYHCPKCNGIIYDLRNSVCGFCGAQLPANMLLTPSEMAALDKAPGGAEQDDDPPVEPASNKLAAFLRDCIGALIVLAMVVWLVYFAVTAIVTGHLYISEARLYRRWTPKPLDGPPAELAGFSFLSLAVAFVLVCASHPKVVGHVPSWARISYWWFFAGWAILYFTARVISHT